MCGICGYAWRKDERPPPLQAMMELQRHRGPDGEGALVDGNIGIGVRRLAIIDIAGGNQPIPNEDKSIWVVLNGEIYNYRDLRQDLTRRGHIFRTRTDTEVLVHLYEERREDMLQHLRGMFAFCIYDQRESTLFLARDPFGEKPLFYTIAGNGLVFASEMNSLLACEDIPRRLDYEALGYYLRASFVPAPLTMFRDVRQLPPGSWMRWRNGVASIASYWEPDYRTDPELLDESEVQARLAEALRRAVSRELVSERPLGVFLSGGMDSSTVAAFCREVGSEQIRTFTVSFEESDYDESAVAREVAKSVAADHTEHCIPNAQFRPELFWSIVDHVGVPFADSSAIPTHLISKEASQHVTVCLSGDGGDEMFGGYPEFRWGLAIQRIGIVPRRFLRWGARVISHVSEWKGLHYSRLLRQARRAFQAAQADGLAQFVDLHSLFNPEDIHVLLEDPRARQIVRAPLERITTLPEQAKEWSALKRLMYFRLKYVLPEDMLVKVDRMSMSSSLEIRAPFLDLDLAKIAMSLPDKFLVRGVEQKYILRRLAEKRLPPVVLQHPKSGFSIPLHRFQNNAYREMSEELLRWRDGPMQLFSSGALEGFRVKALARDRDMADASVYRVSHQLWALMQLAGWAQRFKVGA